MAQIKIQPDGENNENEEERSVEGLFAVIPVVVLSDERLTPTDKLVYAEIAALTNKFGYCFASNDHFTKTIKISSRVLTTSLLRLEKAGYIRREVERGEFGTRRKIWLLLNFKKADR